MSPYITKRILFFSIPLYESMFYKCLYEIELISLR